SVVSAWPDASAGHAVRVAFSAHGRRVGRDKSDGASHNRGDTRPEGTVAMPDYDELLIGGQWTKPSSDQRIEVRSPATLEPVGSVPEALEADVAAAVAAARRAVDTGPCPPTPPAAGATVSARPTAPLAARIDAVRRP